METHLDLTDLTSKLSSKLAHSSIKNLHNSTQLKNFTDQCHTYSTLLVDIEIHYKFFQQEAKFIQSLQELKR